MTPSRRGKPAVRTDALPAYAAANLFIRTKSGEIAPLELNAVQKKLHARLEAQKRKTGRIRALILKARQPGVSTYVEGRFYWLVSGRRGVRAFILTHLRDATDAIFEMVERFHEHNPAEDKPHIGASNAKELWFDALDSGYRVGTAGSRAIGRGHTIQYFHGSEVAHWPSGGAFPAFAHEQALDLLTMMLQQHSGELSRALLVPVSDPDSSIGALPNATDRAAKYLAFDSAGVPIASDGPVTGIPVSTFMETVLDDADGVAARMTLGLGGAAVEDVATGGAGDLLRADGDGSALTGIATGATDQEVSNIMLNAFRIQQVGGLSFQNMIDGFADEFENEDGVDTVFSSSQTYDAAGNYYDNRGTVSMIAAATGSIIGDFDTRQSAAFDGDTAQGSSTAAFKSGVTANSYIGKNFSASPKRIDHAIVYGSTVEGFSTSAVTVTLTLYGKNGSAPSAYNDGTALASDSVTDGPSVTTTLTASTIATWDYVWVAFVHSLTGAFYLSEIELFERAAATNMTLISAITTNPPSSSPASALVALWHEAVDSVILNTDVSVIVSRDGGANWSGVTLIEEADLGGGQKLYVGSFDISGQPSGTNLRYAVTTSNNKEQRIHAVALQWGD